MAVWTPEKQLQWFEMHFPKIFNQWVSGIHVKIEILSDLYTIFNEKYTK